MNNYFKIYKIISFILLGVNVILGGYLIITSILAIAKRIITPSCNLALFITLVVLNIVYIFYNVVVIIYNSKHNKG